MQQQQCNGLDTNQFGQNFDEMGSNSENPLL